jgi:hypothetical protein
MPKKSAQQPENISRLSVDMVGDIVPPSRYCVISLAQDGSIQVRGTDTDVDCLMDSLEEAGFDVKWDYKSPCG